MGSVDISHGAAVCRSKEWVVLIYVDDLNRIYRSIQHFDVVTINPEYSKNFILLRPFLDALFTLDVVFRLNVCRTAVKVWSLGRQGFTEGAPHIQSCHGVTWHAKSIGELN